MSDVGKYIIHMGDSSAMGSLAVVESVGPNMENDGRRYWCRKITNGKPMKCPDSRCDGGCVICCYALKKTEIHFLNDDELKLYRKEKMIPSKKE